MSLNRAATYVLGSEEHRIEDIDDADIPIIFYEDIYRHHYLDVSQIFHLKLCNFS